MKLVRLALFCQPSDTFRLAELVGILGRNRDYNSSFDITGVLAMTQTHFIYLLEGPREAVSQAFTKVVMDPNFKNVVLYGMEEIDEKMFDAGPVDFVSADAFSMEFCQEVVNAPRILPSLLSFANTKRLLQKTLKKRDVLLQSEQLIKDCADEDYFEIGV